MKIHTKFTLSVLIVAICSSSYAENQEVEWGNWAKDDKGIAYGSGLTGSDENQLHKLDQSSLLDYEAEIIEGGLATGTDEGTDSSVSTEIVNDIEQITGDGE